MKRRIIALLCILCLLCAELPIPARASVIESDWVPVELVPQGAGIARRMWRVTRKKYSLQPDEAHANQSGVEILGAAWVFAGESECSYADVPAGFDRTHALYSMLNHQPYTAGEDGSVRYTVKNEWAGYVYWHWMYDTSYAKGWEYRAIYNKKGYGPDNGYYYKFFGAFTSTNGNYASDLYYCNSQSIRNYIVPERVGWEYCQGATRWFRFDYFTSKRTKYDKKIRCCDTEVYDELDWSNVPQPGIYDRTTEYEYQEISVRDYASYYIVLEDVVEPRADKPTGSNLKPGELIGLQCDDPGATILYTVSELGREPGAGDVYTGPFPAPDLESFVLVLRAVKAGMGDSQNVFYSYHVGNLQDYPRVTTLPPETVTNSEALLRMEVESRTPVVAMEFICYERGASGAVQPLQADAQGRCMATELLSGTEYWCIARATNLEGRSSGSLISFTTTGSKDNNPKSISLSPAYAALSVGGVRTLLPTLSPWTAVSDVLWKSEDPGIAAVDANGVVTGVAPGITYVTATTVIGRVSARCTVEVFPDYQIAGSFDFSELHMLASCSRLNKRTGYDTDYMKGGNYQRATAYLTRWDGAVVEANDPYPSNSFAEYHERQEDFHVQEVLYLDWREDPLDNDEIKNAVMLYGAVDASMLLNDAFSAENRTYFYLPADREASIPHSVAIVGWDDDFPADRFSVAPPGNGAFICKSSWGTGVGDEGYLYVSYYDSSLGTRRSGDVNTVFYYTQRSDNYNKLYQYDELGALDKYYFTGSVAWCANVFPRQGTALAEQETLKAVGFYTTSKSTYFELYVVPDYRGVTSLSQLGEPVKTGVIDYGGYHTLVLQDGVTLEAGTRFAVVLRLLPATDVATVFVEAPRLGVSSLARAGAGESFVRDGEHWTDLTAEMENANLCIKAYTLYGDGVTERLGVEPLPVETAYSEEALLAMSGGLEPAYLDYLDAQLAEDGETENYGLIPPTVLPDMEVEVRFNQGAQLPRRFDLREQDLVSPVRNQNPIPACWAFAAYASLESSLLRARKSGYTIVGGLNKTGEDLCILLDTGDGLTLGQGSQRQILATIYPFESNAELCWTTQDPAVATVNPCGVIRAVGPGETVVSVSTESGDAAASVTVTVLPAASPVSLTLSCGAEALTVGEQTLIDYQLAPANSAAARLIWESDRPEVAEVDEYGLVTARGCGSATITARAQGLSVSGSCTVNVDDGRDFYAALGVNELRCVSGSVQGLLSLSVRSRSAATELRLALALYNAAGQLTGLRVRRCAAKQGENRLSFGELDVPAEAVSFRVFVLSGADGAEPLAPAVSGPVKTVGP